MCLQDALMDMRDEEARSRQLDLAALHPAVDNSRPSEAALPPAAHQRHGL